MKHRCIQQVCLRGIVISFRSAETKSQVLFIKMKSAVFLIVQEIQMFFRGIFQGEELRPSQFIDAFQQQCSKKL